MNRICVLIAVDTEGALASGSATGSSYIMDTNGFLGSWGEGSSQLNTVCQDGQAIEWSTAAVNPDGDVQITGFSGPMVDQGICRPAVMQGPDGPFWAGRVETHGQFASWSYTVTLSIAGAAMNLSANVKVA